MIRLLKVQHTFLNVRKTNLIIFIFTFITIFMVIYMSKATLSYDKLLFNRDTYLENYLFDSTNIIKIVLVINVLFIIITNFVLNDYDVYLITRTKREILLFSKLIVSFSVVLVVLFMLYTTFLVCWMITPYEFSKTGLFSNLVTLCLFVLYYFVLGVYLLYKIGNLYVLVLPFLGYIVSSFSIDYDTKIEEMTGFSRLMNVFFPDIVLIDTSFELVYGNLFVFSITMVLLLFLLRLYNQKDL